VRHALFVTNLLLGVTTALTATESRDGTWWIQQREPARLVYVVGMLDGV
jgi:hypothetical protein